MTIKKPASTAAATTGGATIADRFKLDVVQDKDKSDAAGAGVKIALVGALVALGVAGFLAYSLYEHNEFLSLGWFDSIF